MTSTTINTVFAPDTTPNKGKPNKEISGSSVKVAYILGTFPILTTTFIDRELLEAKRLGLDMTLIAIRKSAVADISSAVQELVNETHYLLPVSVLALIKAHLHFLMTRFRSYVGCLLFLLTRRHPSLRARGKTLLHFGEGVLAASMFRDAPIDHIHAHFADRASVIAMVISRLTGVPYSFTAHAVDIYVAPAFLAEKIANAKFVTTCTRYNKEYLEKQTGQAVELVYHGLDFSDICENAMPLKDRGAPMLLSVGQLKEKKGFSYLIHACALLKERNYVFVCEIIGDGPERDRLSRLIRELRLDDTVLLRGALPHAHVIQKYSEATLFALACIVAEDGNRDGIPNVILEAMAHRLPVVSTNVSGIPEVIHNQETGWLVESQNVEALSAAIARVLDDPQNAAAVGENAHSFVEQYFNIRQNVGRLIEMFSGSLSQTTR